MRRLFGALVIGLAAAAAAHAHALYVVPEGADPGKITVVFSDDLAPDARVKDATWAKLAKLKLSARGADGKLTDVKWEKGEHCLKASAPAGTQVVFGRIEYGVSTKGAKPALVKFYPKAIVGGVPAGAGMVNTPVEIVPAVTAGKVRFQVLNNGKPVAGATVGVMLPGKAESAEATTDEQGFTPSYDGTGRYAATVRHAEPKAGEADGQKYEQITHVATLVADVK